MRKIIFFIAVFCVISIFAEWEVVEIYPVPESASGLAYDGEFLYCGIYGANGDEFYRINPADGSYQLLFSNPAIGDCFGLSYDGENLWTTDHGTPSSEPAVAYELNMNGEIVSQFNLPDHYMSGIACDGDNFWVSTYYDPDGYIYYIDANGEIINGFAAPDQQPWDLCLERGNLWMADYWGDSVYKIDIENLTLLEAHPTEGVDPSGIVFDGEFIWYCDNGEGYDQDFLYKVYIGGNDSGYIEGIVSDECSGIPLENVLITVSDLTTVTDESGYYFIEALSGNQTLYASLDWYNEFDQSVNVIPNDTLSFDFTLQPEVCVLPPENLIVDEHCFLEFTPPNVHPLENYNIYLNGQFLENTDYSHYLFRNLETGQSCNIGVSVEYAIWESEIINYQFTPQFSHSYGDIDNDGGVFAYDAGLILQYAVGIDPGASAPLPWENWRIFCADVNADQTIDAYDAALTLQYVVGIINIFPGDNSQ